MAYKKILFRRDPAASWTSGNPVLSAGEVGLETDTGKIKIGNGSSTWTALSYFVGNLPGATLDAIGDVTITSVQNGDFLRYNGSASAWINDPVNLSTDTVGSYVESLIAGTGVTISNNSGEGATPTISIGQAVGTSASVTFGQVETISNLVVGGNLTVNGTTTTLNTDTLSIEDNIVVLNSNVTGVPVLNAGIEVERGDSANVAIRWNESLDVWEITTDGSGYSSIAKISDVVSATDAITVESLSNTIITTPTHGQFLSYNSSSAVWVNDAIDLGTDTTGSYVQSLVAGTGVTLTNNSGESATPTVAIGQSVAASATPTFAGLNLNGNITFEGTTADEFETIIAVTDPTSDRVIVFPDLTGTVVTTGDTGSITSLMIADNTIVDGDINTAAAIAHSKLANATAGQVLLGTTTTGVVTATTISGDITIDGGGVASISANSVALGTDTTGNYMSDLTQGTGVTITHTPGEGSNATIAIGQAVGTSASVTFGQVTTSGDFVVGGNLTVSGTTTSVNTETLTIDDNIVVLNNNVTGTPTENAGIEIERGTSANVLVRWNETNDKWEATNDGTTYGNLVTTADVGTVSSSMIADVSTNARTASYTLVLSDKDKIVEMGVGSANNLTVPLNSSVAFPVGSQINILQTGSGQTTVVAAGGVTINATPGLKIRAQWSYATLIKRATDTWVLVGDVSA
jgi:hypothetical protein